MASSLADGEPTRISPILPDCHVRFLQWMEEPELISPNPPGPSREVFVVDRNRIENRKSDRNRIEIGSKADRNRIEIGSKSDRNLIEMPRGVFVDCHVEFLSTASFSVGFRHVDGRHVDFCRHVDFWSSHFCRPPQTQPSLAYFGASVFRPLEFNNARLVVRTPGQNPLSLGPKSPQSTPEHAPKLQHPHPSTTAPGPNEKPFQPKETHGHAHAHTHTHTCMRTHTHTLSTCQGPKCQIFASWTSSV